MLKKKAILFLSSLVMFSLVVGVDQLALAAAPKCPAYVPAVLCAQNSSNVNALIGNVIEFIIALAGLVVLGYIIWAGFKFITSGGDSGKKEEAQKQIVAAVIGLLIIVFSYFIVSIVFNLLGLGGPGNVKLPCDIYGNDLNGVNVKNGGNCSSGSSTNSNGPQS